MNMQKAAASKIPLNDSANNKTKIAITLLVLAGVVGATTYMIKKRNQK
jgi:hypothetical protein